MNIFKKLLNWVMIGYFNFINGILLIILVWKIMIVVLIGLQNKKEVIIIEVINVWLMKFVNNNVIFI